MTILALEFSSNQRSVALAREGTVLSAAVENGGVRMTNAFGLIAKVLEEAKISRQEVEVIAIGLGPGSYTGIRAAIAVAQGWQLAREVKLLGLSSVEAMVVQAQAKGILGRVNVVVDAQRGEFYLGRWNISAEKLEELSALRIAPAAELAELGKNGEQCIGPAAKIILYPEAATLTTLAKGRTDFISGDSMEPVYLRQTSFVKASGGRMV